MTEHTEDPHLPGVYQKGDVQRIANSRSAAVALVFEGFKRVTEPEESAEESSEREPESPKVQAPKPGPKNQETPKP